MTPRRRAGCRQVAALTLAATMMTSCSSARTTHDHASPGGRAGTPSAGASAPRTNGPTSFASAMSPARPSPPVPVRGRPGSVTIGASGDIIAHPSIIAMARNGSGYAFGPFFRTITPTTSKDDISICQMENPLSSANSDLAREMSFNAPHELASAVRSMGFDGCSTANNHAFDRGLSGVADTRKVLARNGLKAAGPAASASSPGQPATYDAKGLRIAHLSYSYNVLNILDDTTFPKDAPWARANMTALRTTAGIEQDAATARRHGADIVVVSMHWGQEYRPVNAEQRSLARQLLSSGQIDWIVGNHPHAVQACEKIHGRYVNYALGNFFSGQQEKALPGTADGVYASVTFSRDEAGKITESMRYQPIYTTQDTRVVEPVSPAHRPDAYARTTRAMRSLGCDAKATS